MKTAREVVREILSEFAQQDGEYIDLGDHDTDRCTPGFSMRPIGHNDLYVVHEGLIGIDPGKIRDDTTSSVTNPYQSKPLD